MMNSTTSNALWAVACVAGFLRSFTDATAEHLGDQWHSIGVGGSGCRLTCLDLPPQIASGKA